MDWRAAIPNGTGVIRIDAVRQTEEQQLELEQQAPPQPACPFRSCSAGAAQSSAVGDLVVHFAFDERPDTTAVASPKKAGATTGEAITA
jgi:hypothetical protein